jgi:hypothetical protein
MDFLDVIVLDRIEHIPGTVKNVTPSIS